MSWWRRGRLNPEQLDKVRRAVLFGSNTNLKVPIPADAVSKCLKCGLWERSRIVSSAILRFKVLKGKIHPTSKPMYSPDNERVVRSVNLKIWERNGTMVCMYFNPSLNVFSCSLCKWIHWECFRLTVSEQAASYLQYSFSHIRPWCVIRDQTHNSQGIYYFECWNATKILLLRGTWYDMIVPFMIIQLARKLSSKGVNHWNLLIWDVWTPSQKKDGTKKIGRDPLKCTVSIINSDGDWHPERGGNIPTIVSFLREAHSGNHQTRGHGSFGLHYVPWSGNTRESSRKWKMAGVFKQKGCAKWRKCM